MSDIDYGFLRQKYLNDINNLKRINEVVVLAGEDKRIASHALLMKETVSSIKSSHYVNDEEINLRRWIIVTFEKLLKDIKREFHDNNNKLIDHLWNEYGIPVWRKKDSNFLLYSRIEGINIVF